MEPLTPYISGGPLRRNVPTFDLPIDRPGVNPVILIVSFVGGIPILLWLFRFWFEDLDHFLYELGYRPHESFLWNLFEIEAGGYYTLAKLVLAVLLPYAIVAGLTAYTLSRWLG